MAAYSFIILRTSVEQAAWLALTPAQRAAQLAWEASSGSSGADPGYFQGKKFRVVFGNAYAPGLRKNADYQDTLGGRVDRSAGGIYFQWRGMIRTVHTLSAGDTSLHFGNLGDLKTYFLLNNPNGTPSDIVTLVDHDGLEHDGYILGEHVPQPLITSLQGTDAHFFIPLEFQERIAVA